MTLTAAFTPIFARSACSSSAPTFVKFARFKIGPVSVKDLSCRAGALTKAPFVSQAPGVSIAEVMAVTEADLAIPDKVPEMKI